MCREHGGFVIELTDSWNSLDVLVGPGIQLMIENDQIALGQMIKLEQLVRISPKVCFSPAFLC